MTASIIRIRKMGMAFIIGLTVGNMRVGGVEANKMASERIPIKIRRLSNMVCGRVEDA